MIDLLLDHTTRSVSGVMVRESGSHTDSHHPRSIPSNMPHPLLGGELSTPWGRPERKVCSSILPDPGLKTRALPSNDYDFYHSICTQIRIRHARHNACLCPCYMGQKDSLRGLRGKVISFGMTVFPITQPLCGFVMRWGTSARG